MEEIINETAKEGMIQKEFGRLLLTYGMKMEVDIKQVISNQSYEIVEEITQIFQKAPCYPDDQALVEEVIEVLHRHGISTGVCHDY